MSFAYKVSAWNRKRKWESFLKEIKPTAESTILDIGFSEEEYSDTDNFLEKHYPHTEQITALCLETPESYLHARKNRDFQVPQEAIALKNKQASKKYPQLEIITYDGKTFPFADKTFDICWSNAVLEHVGNHQEQIFFLKEIKRVAKQSFITTPNRYFPIEVHTRIPLLHFLPKKVFDRFLHFIGKGWAADEYMYLLSLSDLCKRLEAANITQYRIIKNKLLFFILDFVVIFDND
ncbi:MAG: class I SAM-dependent methyltransferase [Richelia sp. RM2_1_2]|nr:class I SAM-dependent methyltransferase [Richelia sp. SM1_7_0]NJN08578.1 class I SAM-dependent methyltransferase [Richelia sp. RM1_1_1]NJO27594.1 class I SAM-dependent methyltransferase [Richelia sp. SL_2_1]NJO57321.1 class I SAM-dependent methyltransferase [Richelia sp. RM2_1_2]